MCKTIVSINRFMNVRAFLHVDTLHVKNAKKHTFLG